MRRTAKDFRRDAKKHDPYEVELADGTVVAMRPTRDISIEDQITLQRWTPENDGGTTPLELQLRHMTGEHYEAFWAEWKTEPRYVLDALVNDVDEHFIDDVDEGKEPKSTG